MDLETIRITLRDFKLFNINLIDVLKLLATLVFIIAVIFQIYKILTTKSVKDYSLYFILLQLIGTPEGGGAGITGYMTGNKELLIMGILGFIYYAIALYFKLTNDKKR